MFVGVLVNFGIDVFNFMNELLLVIGLMVVVYLCGKCYFVCFVMFVVVVVGFLMVGIIG